MKDVTVYVRIGDDGNDVAVGTISANDSQQGHAMLAGLLREVADRLETDA